MSTVLILSHAPWWQNLSHEDRRECVNTMRELRERPISRERDEAISGVFTWYRKLAIGGEQ